MEPQRNHENVEVRRNDVDMRFDLVVGGRTVGFAAYLDHGEQRIFTHTEIDQQFAGKGLSSHLIHDALVDARAAGLRVVPVCPLVGHYISRHGEVADIVDPVTDAILRAVRSQQTDSDLPDGSSGGTAT